MLVTIPVSSMSLQWGARNIDRINNRNMSRSTFYLISLIMCMPVFFSGLYAWKIYHQLPKTLKLFCWFLFVSALIQLVSVTLAFCHVNNMPALHLYVGLGMVCLILFYKEVLDGLINTKVFDYVIIFFSIFHVTNSIFFQGVLVFDSNAIVVAAVLVVIFSITTFIVLMNDIVKERRKGMIVSLNWINSGLFIYYLSSLLIFYFGSVITSLENVTQVKFTWILHGVFSSVMYLCASIGLWKRPSQ